MFWKPLMKNPILAIGIIMVAALLLDLSRRGILPFISEKIIATSCKSARVMLDKRAPDHWKTRCENNNMTVTIQSQVSATKYNLLTKTLYRELANHLQFVAKNTLNESLERTLIVRIHLIHPRMEINAITEGKDLAKLASMDQSKLIAQHLRNTVQVQHTSFK